MIFLNLALTIQYTCANFKSRYLKTTSGTFFEKTIKARGLKLGSYVPLTSFYYKLISGILEKIFIRFLWPKMGLKMCQNQFFLQISQKVKVLELNVVFSTNINGTATIDLPTIDPPTIDPPTIDPPTIDPLCNYTGQLSRKLGFSTTIDPPTIDPPTIDPLCNYTGVSCREI